MHIRTDVAEVAKLNYLRGQLTSTASQLTEDLNTMCSNYQVAVDLLKETCKHPERIVRNASWKQLELLKHNYMLPLYATF